MNKKILFSIMLTVSILFCIAVPAFADVDYSGSGASVAEDTGDDMKTASSTVSVSEVIIPEDHDDSAVIASIEGSEQDEGDSSEENEQDEDLDRQTDTESTDQSVEEEDADDENLVGASYVTPDFNACVSTYSELVSRLETLKSRYVESYWTTNGQPADSSGSTSLSYYGIQCNGFAKLVFQDLFNTGNIGAYDSNKYYFPNANGAYLIDKNASIASGDADAVKSILQYGEIGDFIQVHRRGKDYGHSMILAGKDDGGIWILDCNSEGHCKVQHYYQSYSTFATKNDKMSLYRSVNYPPDDRIIWGDPVDLGDDFFANIENQDNGYLITNEDGNLVGRAANESDSQLWHFLKNDDGSYRIFTYNGDGVIDIFGVADENDANAYVYGEYGGGANQQFYIYERYGAYNLRPKHSETKALDMTLSGNYNISIWDANNYYWAPQSFNIINKRANWGNPVDLGDDFYANIENQDNGYLITNEDGNLVGRAANGSDSQLWHFMKNDDGSYRIFTHNGDGVIDIFGVADENDANAYVYGEYVGGANQQFYIYERYGAYNFRPKHSETKALDMNLSGNYNVSIWDAVFCYWAPQSFNIINKRVHWGNPVDLGDDFYANIENQDNGYLITNEDGNLVGRAANGSDSQLWHFLKNDDGSYKIFTHNGDGVIDIFGVADENDANAYVYGEYVGGANQEFYIYERFGAYNFRPKHSETKALDMTMSGNYNVSIWDAVFIYWAPQSFNINEIDMKDLEIMSLSDDFYGKNGTPASFHIEVEGSGNISYQWQYRTAGMTGWRTPSQASAKTADYTFTLKPSYDNIEVRCIVSDDSGNEIISEIRKANVFAFTSQPADATASEGEVVNFEVYAIGRNVTYQWYYKRPDSTWKKTTVTGSKTAVLPISAGTINDGTSYRCVITDEAGNKLTSSAGLLTLDNSLRITGISEDAYDVNGESVTFHIDAAGQGDLTYQWQYKLAGETKWRTPAQASAKTPDYVFKLRPSYDNIEVRCIVKDASGNSVTSDVRKANVFAITGQPQDAELAPGEQTTFAVEAVGKELVYQWYYKRPDGSWKKVTVAGYNTAALVITANTKNDGTKFRCRITDGLGNVLVSAAALLTQP